MQAYRKDTLDRLCDSDDAYRWLCGGVGVNHHTLGDLRLLRRPLRISSLFIPTDI